MINKILTYFYKRQSKDVGKNTIIRYACTIDNGSKIVKCKNVFIREHVWLNAGNINDQYYL